MILAFLLYLASFQSYGSLKKLERAIHNWLMVPTVFDLLYPGELFQKSSKDCSNDENLCVVNVF